MDCTMYVAKTKVLIRFGSDLQLRFSIYAKNRFFMMQLIFLMITFTLICSTLTTTTGHL